MGAMPNEPSMEEILSSIKRIIAEEDVATQAPRVPRRAAQSASDELLEGTDLADDQILELTDALPGEGETKVEAVAEEAPQTDTATAQEEPVMTAPAKPESKPAPESKAKVEARAPKPRTAQPAAAQSSNGQPSNGTPPETPSAVMSDISAQAARESLVNLSKLLVSPEEGPSPTLEGLVREMLRPMLKEWLDAQLPGMVEGMVKREIDRITGRV